jgi:hypothetical protein
MSTKFVKWKPTRNTERGAIKRFGEEWIVQSHFLDTSKLLIVPKDDPKADMRWITHEQVISQRWELEPI